MRGKNVYILIFLSVACSSCQSRQKNVLQWSAIDSAMRRGDSAGALICKREHCSEAMKFLSESASLKVQGEFAASLSAAERCINSATEGDRFTRIMCAAMIYSDQFALRNFAAKINAEPAWLAELDRASGNKRSKLGQERARNLPEEKFINLDQPFELPIDSGVVGSGINAPIIAAQVNGINLRFLVDTGSDRSFMTQAAAKASGVVQFSDFELTMVDGQGKSSSGHPALANSFSMGPLRVENKYFMVGSGSALPFDGIVGLDLLSKIRNVSFASKEIRFNEILSTCVRYPISYSTDVFGQIYGLIVGGSDFNGKQVGATLDSGNIGRAYLTNAFSKRPPHHANGAISAERERTTVSGVVKEQAILADGVLHFLGRSMPGPYYENRGNPDSGIEVNVGLGAFQADKVIVDFHNHFACLERL